MGVEKVIYPILSGDDSVKAIADTRIYPLSIPEDAAAPCVVYKIIAAVAETTLNDPLGLVRTRVQFDCVGRTYSEASSFDEAYENRQIYLISAGFDSTARLKWPGSGGAARGCQQVPEWWSLAAHPRDRRGGEREAQ